MTVVVDSTGGGVGHGFVNAKAAALGGSLSGWLFSELHDDCGVGVPRSCVRSEEAGIQTLVVL